MDDDGDADFSTFYSHPFLLQDDSKAPDIEGTVSENADEAARWIPEESEIETQPGQIRSEEEVRTENERVICTNDSFKLDILW